MLAVPDARRNVGQHLPYARSHRLSREKRKIFWGMGITSSILSRFRDHLKRPGGSIATSNKLSCERVKQLFGRSESAQVLIESPETTSARGELRSPQLVSIM